MTPRVTRAMLCATLLAAGLSLSGPVYAAFISGVWQGGANYDTEGKFSDCTMTAQASSGVLIGFIISKNFEWGLVLADETREFEVGTTESVALHIDQRDPIPAIAKVIDVHGIVIPLENSERVLDALREGEVLTIVAKRANISFKLTGTKAAIAALAACLTENLTSEKVDASTAMPRRMAELARSAAREQLLDVGELELDMGRAAVVALPGKGRALHVAEQRVHLLGIEPPACPHAAVAGHRGQNMIEPPGKEARLSFVLGLGKFGGKVGEQALDVAGPEQRRDFAHQDRSGAERLDHET